MSARCNPPPMGRQSPGKLAPWGLPRLYALRGMGLRAGPESVGGYEKTGDRGLPLQFFDTAKVGVYADLLFFLWFSLKSDFCAFGKDEVSSSNLDSSSTKSAVFC